MVELDPPRKTVFLDRDGVINRRIMADYVTGWDEFIILDGALEGIRLLHEAGFRIAVVTNQRGIAIGRMTREAVDAIHAELSRKVRSTGGRLEEFYVCPHDRDEGCPCRKPMSGLLEQAHSKEPVDWSRSFLIGDSDSDILAGRRMGLFTIKVQGPSRVGADRECTDLFQAARLIHSKNLLLP